MRGPETSLRLVLVAEDRPRRGVGRKRGGWPARPFHFPCEDGSREGAADLESGLEIGSPAPACSCVTRRLSLCTPSVSGRLHTAEPRIRPEGPRPRGGCSARCRALGLGSGRTCARSLLPSGSVPGPACLDPCHHSESTEAAPQRAHLSPGTPGYSVTLSAHPAHVRCDCLSVWHFVHLLRLSPPRPKESRASASCLLLSPQRGPAQGG